MPSDRSKKTALAFLEAHLAGDIATAKSLCAPNFESIIHAPVDLFPHLGRKQGLSWIEESIQAQDKRYSQRRFDVASALGDDEEAGIYGAMRLTKRSDDRVIEFMTVHLFRFRNGLIERHREVFDSFSLVEQLIGKDLTPELSEPMSLAMKEVPGA